MVFGSFDVAKQLLEAKADPTKRMAGNGFDSFMVAAMFGKPGNIRAWLQYFDGASAFLERTDLTCYSTPLVLAAFNVTNGGEETVQTLLDAKANPHHLEATGSSALHNAASNQNNTAGLVVQLVQSGANVNLQQTPRTRKWRWIQRFARWAVEHGAKGGMLQRFAVVGGVTPLTLAAREGKVAEVQQLLDMAADPTVRNVKGLTALEIARAEFGGHLPSLLRQQLDRT